VAWRAGSAGITKACTQKSRVLGLYFPVFWRGRDDKGVLEHKHQSQIAGTVDREDDSAGQMFQVTCGEVFVVGFCLKLIVDTLMRQLVTNCIIKMLKIAYLSPGKTEFPQFSELGKLLNFLDTKGKCHFPVLTTLSLSQTPHSAPPSPLNKDREVNLFSWIKILNPNKMYIQYLKINYKTDSELFRKFFIHSY
jgi:hypothetical protein